MTYRAISTPKTARSIVHKWEEKDSNNDELFVVRERGEECLTSLYCLTVNAHLHLTQTLWLGHLAIPDLATSLC